jgi:methyl-accepting chemotaxis protein
MRKPAFTLVKKFSVLVIISGVAMAMLAVVAVVQGENRIMAERRAATKAVVESALGVISYYGGLAESGDLSKEAAQKAAIGVVSSLRYDGDQYFWINDMQPVMIEHPVKPELNGTDLSQNEDPNGKKLFVAFVDKVKADGAGFVDYMWPKPGAEAPQPKISYVAGYTPWGWVVGSGVYVDDVRAAAMGDARVIVITVVAAILVLTGISLLIGRSVVGPIRGATRALLSGDPSARLDAGEGRTELEQLAGALNEALDRNAAVARDVGGVSQEVLAAAARLVATSEELSASTQACADRGTEANTSARSVSAGIDSVAAGATQMGASISEIARNASEAASIAASAVEAAQRTTATVESLGESSAQIGSVVKVITSIAEQTNLLALNATIEAARAGEAGKGFAVVANEVKELAQGTATATGDIGNQVQAIQEAVARAASEISAIAGIIAKINDYQTTIAGAVEEQTATTSAMANTVADIASGGRAVAVSLDEVNTATSRTSEQSGVIRGAAEELEQTAVRLQSAIQSLGG